MLINIDMRAVWSGAMSFGLVNIPVSMYSAVAPKELSFHFLHKKDLSPIRFARVCRQDGKEIPYDDIVRGYEYAKGDYVVLTEEDFKKANVREVSTIDIMNFVEEAEIDVRYFEKPYYLEPKKGSAKAYALLAEALRRAKKVAIARFVIHKKEHLAAIKSQDGMLVLEQIRFQEELREPKIDTPPAMKKTASSEVDLALQLIDQLTVPFKPETYKDTYTEDLKQIIEQKAKGRTPKAKGVAPEPVQVHDLMEILKKSLKEEQKRVSAHAKKSHK